MRALIDFTTDTIQSWGTLYDERQYDGVAYDVPQDYSPEKYKYEPSNPGEYDADGFVEINS
jgi:flagellar basal body rod protein FlgC